MNVFQEYVKLESIHRQVNAVFNFNICLPDTKTVRLVKFAFGEKILSKGD